MTFNGGTAFKSLNIIDDITVKGLYVRIFNATVDIAKDVYVSCQNFAIKSIVFAGPLLISSPAG